MAFHHGLRINRMLLIKQDKKLGWVGHIAHFLFILPDATDTTQIAWTFLNIMSSVTICQAHSGRTIVCCTVPTPTHCFVCLVSHQIDFYLPSLLHLHHSVMHSPDSYIGWNAICRRLIPTITPGLFLLWLKLHWFSHCLLSD